MWITITLRGSQLGAHGMCRHIPVSSARHYLVVVCATRRAGQWRDKVKVDLVRTTSGLLKKVPAVHRHLVDVQFGSLCLCLTTH